MQPRLQHHVDALRREERAVRTAARSTPDRLEQRYVDLITRLDVAERSLEVDAARERARFAAAVEAELRSLDVYIDRLEDASMGDARMQAQGEIADLRTRREQLANELMRLRHCAGDAWHAERTRVAAEREELEHKADELSAKLH